MERRRAGRRDGGVGDMRGGGRKGWEGGMMEDKQRRVLGGGMAWWMADGVDPSSESDINESTYENESPFPSCFLSLLKSSRPLLFLAHFHHFLYLQTKSLMCTYLAIHDC